MSARASTREAKSSKVGERAVGFALGDDFLRGELADALDAGEAEADAAGRGGVDGRERAAEASTSAQRPTFAASAEHRREHLARLVHVGAEHLQAHRLALGDEVGDFFRVAELGAEHGGHELHRVVRLQVAGLVAEDRRRRRSAIC